MNTELTELKRLMSKNSCLKSIQSSKTFWLENNAKFPLFIELAIITLNINSSSAAVERYFSTCGFINNERAANASSELFTARCCLRANITIMNELKKIDCFFFLLWVCWFEKAFSSFFKSFLKYIDKIQSGLLKLTSKFQIQQPENLD